MESIEIGDNSGDLIAQLGHLCLGSRLKRLGERLQSGVASQLVSRGLAVQPGQLPLLWALREEGPLPVGALSARLGISQPGVSRIVAALQKDGLVIVTGVRRDKRQRRVAISPAGDALMADLSASLFPAVRDAVSALCDAAGPDFLNQIARMEEALAVRSLDTRIAAAGAGGETRHG
ncbi:putative MarR family transcriptional regulator [Sphingobium sp. SYK-6]|uniref:MarR family winged helix-turn-helix transcriptional regulator n=1 Tax=Sphingobium sp. (strain NBRC 103272 / SYK-6) TaxID=627192 RepID=UPI000227770C|nr:MarR family transcriptional regulator [Sphingobium sp. SYK-6]BAK66780.1 putative MarR family transcriptional regulator [Sphingobium sp. SYK-6]